MEAEKYISIDATKLLTKRLSSIISLGIVIDPAVD